jgi:hypothetical protein
VYTPAVGIVYPPEANPDLLSNVAVVKLHFVVVPLEKVDESAVKIAAHSAKVVVLAVPPFATGKVPVTWEVKVTALAPNPAVPIVLIGILNS